MGEISSENRQNEKVTIMEWNIRHGGSRERLNGIIETVRHHNPDILVLTEFRKNPVEPQLRLSLEEMGYVHQIASDIPERVNGILVVSKIKMKSEVDPICMHRLLPVRFPSLDLHLLALHIPGSGDKWDKRECWDRVIDYAKRHNEERVVLIGDYNTGLTIDAEGAPFTLGEKMRELQSVGFIDGWRSRNSDAKGYTWWSTAKNGFRLDYAYLSPPLASELLEIWHSHEERMQGFSDHSSIIIVIRAINNCAEKATERPLTDSK